MGEIDLRITQEEAEKISGFPLIEPGIYDFRVAEVDSEARNKDNTRDMWVYRLELFNSLNSEFNGLKLKYYCPLPFETVDGKLDTGGIGLLQNLCKGTNVIWEGTKLDPTSILGREGKLEIVQGEYDGKPTSTIKRIIC